MHAMRRYFVSRSTPYALACLLQKLLILKEMWLLHIAHGEFYEAYHLYQDKILHVRQVWA
jgi:hypothetical protein